MAKTQKFAVFSVAVPDQNFWGAASATTVEKAVASVLTDVLEKRIPASRIRQYAEPSDPNIVGWLEDDAFAVYAVDDGWQGDMEPEHGRIGYFFQRQ